MAVILGLSIGVIYRSSLRAPFIFDDRMNVLGNPSIIRLWPLIGTDLQRGTARSSQGFFHGRPPASELDPGRELPLRQARSVRLSPG